jgi:hypothetical protein
MREARRNQARIPRRLVLGLGAAIGAAVYWSLWVAPISALFRDAQNVEIANSAVRKQKLELERDVAETAKLVELTRTDAGKEQTLRGGGYVKRGQRPLRGPGVGSAPR